jgi:two-component system, NtrC family, sensor histidine kinase PilS
LSELAQKSEFVPDFQKSKNQMVIIQGIRLGFLTVILLLTLGFQALQPEFVNTEVLMPVFILMAAAFVLNALYMMWIDKALVFWPSTAFLFFFESVFITYLIHYTGVNQSIFLFLYLINIILCGFVFQRRGAIVLALWTSILFSLLMIIGPELKGQTLVFAVGLNNLAFFAVAALSGYLSEQLNFMGRELKSQGKDIRALRNINALILDNISTGLLTVDSSGLILQANRASGEILGLAAGALVGRSIESVAPGLLGRTKVAAEKLHRIEVDKTNERFDFSYQNGDGERLLLEVTLSELPVESEIGGYIFAFQDLTKVRRLEFQMRQSEKMAAVGQLAAGIAHEIRNPLASISGSIQLLGGSFTGRQAEEHKLMAIVLREVDRLNNLITEFLDFVRPDTLHDDPVDVNALVKDVAELMKLNKNLNQATKQVFDLSASREIAGHRDKLKQALMNIVINAYQAMNDASEPEIGLTTHDVNNTVVIRIKDRGCGIDESGLKKIFEPFHTTKPKGTGLGLAVTHKIIENHGGRIFVESTKGVGTEFVLEFPARSERRIDKNDLADSRLASENFAIAFRGQKRSSS